jgi:hypothetical protein
VTGSTADRRAANALVNAAAATVEFQLAGKSTRDALFLSTFGVDPRHSVQSQIAARAPELAQRSIHAGDIRLWRLHSTQMPIERA